MGSHPRAHTNAHLVAIFVLLSNTPVAAAAKRAKIHESARASRSAMNNWRFFRLRSLRKWPSPGSNLTQGSRELMSVQKPEFDLDSKPV